MKATNIFFGLLLSFVLLSSCDNINEDDRYYMKLKPVIENPRNLLIMEFTGNSCSNCPNGAAVISQIKASEPAGRVISVGLHPYGVNYTNPVRSKYTSPEKQDFRSNAATAIYDFYKPSGFPYALFNGVVTDASSSIPSWYDSATAALKQSAAMAIEASSTYDATSRNLKVDYSIDFGNTINKKLSVTVWLVENKIMGTQTMPNGSLNADYEHNHVLRASLNGDWGEYIGNSFSVGNSVAKSAQITLNEKWVAENCNLVIYVYGDDDKVVEQAIEIPAVPSQSE